MTAVVGRGLRHTKKCRNKFESLLPKYIFDFPSTWSSITIDEHLENVFTVIAHTLTMLANILPNSRKRIYFRIFDYFPQIETYIVTKFHKITC